MSVEKPVVQQKLQDALSPLHMDLTDVSNGCGTSYSTVIVSEKFVGKSLLERHRMVNGALAEEMKQIHAFSMKTLTPEQWEKQKLG